MPIIEMTLVEGNTQEEREQCMEQVTKAAVETLNAPLEAVRIIMREVPKTHFAVAGKPRSRAG